MRRIVAALVLVGMSASSEASEPSEGPPPLTAPELAGPVAESTSELPPAIETAPSPSPGQVLVVPGITTPRSGDRSIRRKPVPDVRTSQNVGSEVDVLPPLYGPSENGSTGKPIGRGSSVSARPPLTLESVPAGSDEFNVEPSRADSSSSSKTISPKARTTPVPLRRRPGLLGRFLPPVPGDVSADDARDKITVEPKTDPAADAALKRKVERQIQQSLGTRVSSYEVRVVGREVSIRARASRFWQKRAMRHTLETLPALNGYKAIIDVGE